MSGQTLRLKTPNKTKPMDPELALWLRASLVELWVNGGRPNGFRMAETEAGLPHACECTTQQVAAHKAWLRMYMERALKSAGDDCDWFDAIRIWGSLKLNGLVPEIEDITPNEIAVAANDVSLSTPSDFARFQQALLIFEELLFKSKRVMGKTADLVSYGQKIKTVWRNTWEDFLRHRWPAKIESSVLCLPGRRPEREVGVYRRLGYENFVDGIEGGSAEAKAEFRARSEFMGIGFSSSTGRLEKCLVNNKVRFEVVSLDLIGPYSGITEQILSQVRLAERAWVMINLQASREQDSASYALEATYRLTQTRKNLQALREEFRRSTYWTQSHRERLARFSGGTKVQSDISDLRDRALDTLLMSQFGMRIESDATHESVIRELAPFLTDETLMIEKVRSAAIPIESEILGVLLNGGNSGMILEYVRHLFRGVELVTDVATARPKVKEIRKYSYVSKMGRKPTTFFTTMAEIHSAAYMRPRYETFRRTVSFFLGCMRAAKEGSLHLELLDRNGRRKPQQIPLSLDDQLGIVGSSPARTLSFRRFLSDLRDYDALLKEYPGSDPVFVEALPRVELTAD